jgi:hypothetical protein
MLGHVQDVEQMQSIVAHVVDALPSGSHLALWDSTSTSQTYVDAAAACATTGAVPYQLRSVEQIRQCFDGLELVEPGLVPITQWRPDGPMPGTPKPVDGYGAIGRKP